MKVAGSREQGAEGGEQEGFFKKIPPLKGVGGCD
jgi:hypothetical protein